MRYLSKINVPEKKPTLHGGGIVFKLYKNNECTFKLPKNNVHSNSTRTTNAHSNSTRTTIIHSEQNNDGHHHDCDVKFRNYYVRSERTSAVKKTDGSIDVLLHYIHQCKN